MRDIMGELYIAAALDDTLFNRESYQERIKRIAVTVMTLYPF